MCGITGIVDKRGVDDRLLIAMRDAMVHRGPDDAGIWLRQDRTVGLAHRRLSIIDLSPDGKQPMVDRTGKICITFNGEIYNFQAIREELEKSGHVFTSRSDTEVLLNAYEEWGVDCLQRFNGMFAFGLYDRDKDILFLARDRVGKKPLYYTHGNGRFMFSSEIKALLKDGSLAHDIDLQALNYYLTFGYIAGEQSIFSSIKKLPPAHAMIYDIQADRVTLWEYWDPLHAPHRVLSEPELLDELDRLLLDAVRLRMISDVPLGAFLSGGVDSSLIVAMMHKVSVGPVKTFSIGFEESRYNELSFARVIADYFKTQHCEIMVKPDAFSVLPELVRQFDEPFADSSMIPTYYVSKATREHVTVALSGDGGDELFGGYTSYQATLGNYYIAKMIPAPVRRGISHLSAWLPERWKGKRQLLRLQYDPYDAFVDRCSHTFFSQRYRTKILKPDVLASLNDRMTVPEKGRRDFLKTCPGDFINQLSFADFKMYLPDDILTKVDRASMLVSLEVRAPLLDYRIAEFSFRQVPGNLKVKGMTKKYLLKKLAQRYLPGELDMNRKWGFAIPVAEWFRGPLLNQTRDILLADASGLFRQDAIEHLLDEHRNGIDHAARLFALLVFNLWEKTLYA
jgi:asparagine synthase (glutamine-hydrolysing)